jgi:hypothetical protein
MCEFGLVDMDDFWFPEYRLTGRIAPWTTGRIAPWTRKKPCVSKEDHTLADSFETETGKVLCCGCLNEQKKNGNQESQG